MKWKLFARRLSVSAPRMTIRRHVPWPLRVLSLALALALGAVLATWLWQALTGDSTAQRRQMVADLADTREKLSQEQAERARLALIVNSADSQLKVEQTAAERLAGTVKQLEAENARLKTDLAYLESLLPASESAADGAVTIRRLEVETGAADGMASRLRYRALLMQGGRGEREFTGTLQLVVATLAAGKPGSYTWPDQAPAGAQAAAKVSFKRIQRVEGGIELPVGVTIRSVQLRVMERGVLRAQQSATP